MYQSNAWSLKVVANRTTFVSSSVICFASHILVNFFFFFSCVSCTWGCGFHTNSYLEWRPFFCIRPMTYGFPLICGMKDILNLPHGMKIIYLFLIIVQALSLHYNPLLIIHPILVVSSVARHTYIPYDFPGLFIIHHDGVHYLLLLATL
jgi:hypothetical protein